MSTRSKYTPQELAEAIVYPVTLTVQQRKQAVEQLAVARKKGKKETTENNRLMLQLLQLKFQMEDYIEHKQYDSGMHFGHFLKRYIGIVGMKRKTFGEAIGIDGTVLSQLINKHLTPADYIFIRLEFHSNGIIPATYWYHLVEQEKGHMLQTDKAIRRKENRFVTNRLAVDF